MGRIVYLKLLILIIAFLCIKSTAFSADFIFNEKAIRSWEVWNYGKKLAFRITSDNASPSKYLEITLGKHLHHELKMQKNALVPALKSPHQ